MGAGVGPLNAGLLLFDTNILIDYFNGIVEARPLVERTPDRAISIVSWIELLSGSGSETERQTLKAFLAAWQILALGDVVAEAAADIRRQHRLKLPDAIIYATAAHHRRTLVTRNKKDFPAGTPGVRIPYQLTPQTP